MENKQGILLESGTNELELVEFKVGKNAYGINVIKVKEILQPLPLTMIPHSHDHIEGIVQLRGEVLPVVNMANVLGTAFHSPENEQKFIVAEFNGQRVIFHVDQVSKIHRFTWNDIEKPSEMYQGASSQIIGVIKMGAEMLLLLDFEKIIVDINPSTGIQVGDITKLGPRERSSKSILVAEDSPLLRKLIQETLDAAGYSHLTFFENGEDAFSYLESIVNTKSDIAEHVQLVITDIEMPRMDGHTLTRKIKDDARLEKLPVLIFSSLITNDLRHKGEQVGAQEQVSKPEIAELVMKIDQYIL
ncbi:chemotaxis protein [Paenisporosarcina cavernae]|uniref:Chemotaxis signal transduction protein CheV n=1 Tax=Paenisporosarcina cavernae TaxID=2320858 RepID=A0A385YRG0_9BACL|nr:chemotaxis protein [Paenisporosarcina cavernae]AYC29071.1 chemotaxis signal transduction protein CheV [Paenisporosarcina cavernae]